MLSGDFTCLPPSGIDLVAEKLVGERLDQDRLTRAIAAAFATHAIEMPGVEPGDIATAVMAAVHPAD
jgi:lipoate-protein ligase A